MSLFQNRLFRNTSALLWIQVVTWILPLILLPYYTRLFGLGLFGVVAFVISAIQLSAVITDFGFSLSATEDISRNRDDKPYIEETLGAILLIKLGLLSVAAAAVNAVPYLLPERYGDHRLLFVLAVLPIAGTAYQPVWFFQGLEKMKALAVYTVIAKTAYLGLALALVRRPDQYYMVPVALGLSQLLAAGLGLALIHREGYGIAWPRRARVAKVFSQSATFFASRVSVALYTSGSVFLLGVFGSHAAVALFSVAEQLYRAIQSVFAPVGQALYPYMVREKNLKVFGKALMSAMAVAVVGIFVGYFVSPTLVRWIFGADFLDAVPLLYCFFFVVLVNVPGTLLGYPLLGAFGQSRWANWSVVVGSAVHLTGLLILGGLFGLTGPLVIGMVFVTESLVMCIRGYFGWRLARSFRAS